MCIVAPQKLDVLKKNICPRSKVLRANVKVTEFLFFFEIGKQEAAEATLEALKVVPESLGKWASILVEICAYAGKEYM